MSSSDPEEFQLWLSDIFLYGERFTDGQTSVERHFTETSCVDYRRSNSFESEELTRIAELVTGSTASSCRRTKLHGVR